LRGRNDSGSIEIQIANQYCIVNFPIMRAQWRTCVAVICLALAYSAWAATPTVLNYQGRVSTNGIRFNGHGFFVFAIQDSNGAILWSSGVFPVAGSTNMPPAAWRLDVREGAYKIRLGDTGVGMPPLDIDPLIRAAEPALHVWFSDGRSGWRELNGVATLKPVLNSTTNASLFAPITSSQADAILRELRDVRVLLQQQNPSSKSQPRAEPPKTVTVSLADSPSLGSTNAGVVLVEFTDFQCAFCKRAHDDLMPALRKKYIDTGKLRLVSRNLPLAIHANAEPAALAALCAHQQNQFWPMYDQLFALSTALTSTNFIRAATELNLNLAAFTACLESKSAAPQLARDKQDAARAGITGTPTFVLGHTKGGNVTGMLIVGARSVVFFESEIEKLLNNAK
jgi:protein-disulfide isomerase